VRIDHGRNERYEDEKSKGEERDSMLEGDSRYTGSVAEIKRGKCNENRQLLIPAAAAPA
jgi:hypothetical protein